MSAVTATRFMGVAATFGSKSFIVKGLSATALYELAAPSTPDELLAAAAVRHTPPRPTFSL